MLSLRGVHFGFGEVELGIFCGDGPHQQVEQYRQHQHCRQHGGGQQSAAEYPAFLRGCVLVPFHHCGLLSVPAALFQPLRGEEQEHRRYGQVVDQCGDGKAAVNKFFKGGKQAQGAEHRAESFGQPAALEQKQRRKRHAAPRKGKAAQRKAFCCAAPPPR